MVINSFSDVRNLGWRRTAVASTEPPLFLLAYCLLAGAVGVTLVFAAFLAGFAVVHKKRRISADALEAISKASFAFFIPVYLAVVGLKLDLIYGISLYMLAAFLVGSCLLKLASVTLAGHPRFAEYLFFATSRNRVHLGHYLAGVDLVRARTQQSVADRVL